jgi:outer membrane receptor protein involved in Fe transport
VLSPKFNFPFAYAAELDGAIREIDNSYAGTNDAFTIGAKFSPIKDLEFRGNITHSVRAPSIEELFLPTSNIQTFAQDPCDPNYINGLTAERAANCAKAFAALGASLNGFKSNVVNASVLGQTSGNSTLQNEKANSWTAGFVVRPHWIPHLTMALDWVNIHLKDPITSLSLTQVMDACYDSPTYPNPFCSLFTRNGSGQVTGYSLPLENLGAELFSGAQLDTAYNIDVAKVPYVSMLGLRPDGQYGNLTFDLSGFFLNNQNEQILGVITKLRGDIGYAKFKANGSVRYRLGRFMVYLNGRWVDGGYSNVQLQRSSQQLFSVAPYWVWNGAVSYDLTEKITAELTINDLFNQGPPKNAYLLGGNSALATYDYFGQAFVMKLKARF